MRRGFIQGRRRATAERKLIMFTLTQWLQLGATMAIPAVLAWLVTRGTCAMVDRDIRRYREVDKVLELDGDGQ
jgi:hypothetical protein